MHSHRLKIALLVIGVLSVPATWYYVAHIWNAPSRGIDLYPRWRGSHELLLNGRNPYSQEVTHEIQVWTYGRDARPGEDEERFAYPPYVVFLMAPTVHTDFSRVDAIFLWLDLALTAATVPLWLRLIRWKPPRPAYALAFLFIMGSFVVIHSVLLRQLTLVIAFLIASAAALVSAGALLPAGILLALATIKPQLVFLLLPSLFVWCVVEWRTRQRLFWSFLATLTVLFVGSFLLLPTWPRDFANALVAYGHYTDGRSVLKLMFTRRIGQIVGVLVVLAAFLQSIRGRNAAAHSREFATWFVIALIASVVVIPTVAIYNQVLLIPGLLIVMRDASLIWNVGGKIARLTFVALWTILTSEWITSVGLTVIALVLPHSSARRLWFLPVSISLLAAPALLLLMFLTANARFSQADAEFDSCDVPATAATPAD